MGFLSRMKQGVKQSGQPQQSQQHHHQQQIVQAPQIPWDGTKFKIQLKMAKSRIDIQRGKKDNEIEQQRRKIAQHLIDKKEPLARILGDRILREKKLLISFDIIETCIEVLISSNNNLSMNNDLQNTPNDLKESISSICFASSRVNIPELISVCDILKNHFGHQIINDIVSFNNQSPYVSNINEILILQLAGNPPDGYLILQELSQIAIQHNINWNAPPEESDLNSFDNNRNNNDDDNNGNFGNDHNNINDNGDIGFDNTPSNIPGYSNNMSPSFNPSAPPPNHFTPSAPPPNHFPTNTPPVNDNANIPSPFPNMGRDTSTSVNDADLQARFKNILDDK